MAVQNIANYRLLHGVSQTSYKEHNDFVKLNGECQGGREEVKGVCIKNSPPPQFLPLLILL